MNAKQISTSSDAATCRKISAIRTKARAALGLEIATKCPTCARPFDAPYRAHVVGVGLMQRRADAHEPGARIVEGCVDACHTGHLIPGGYYAQWHERQAARVIRLETLEGLR